MADRYAVAGNPIAHSRSPAIHAQFAGQTGQSIEYGRLLAPLDGFAATVDAFRGAGGRGLNVTVPFKLDAFDYANEHSARARAAGAVNTLRFDGAHSLGDNTDGVGLTRDLQQRLQCSLADVRVLLLGAGGAARGVVLPLLEAGAACVLIANRTGSKAQALAQLFGDPRVLAAGFDVIAAAPDSVFDLILNATSAGLSGQVPPLAATWYRQARLAYDLVYAARPTGFMTQASAAGCPQVSDGLGMLVEQAAESFFVWRGVRPHTAPVFTSLRAQLDSQA